VRQRNVLKPDRAFLSHGEPRAVVAFFGNEANSRLLWHQVMRIALRRHRPDRMRFRFENGVRVDFPDDFPRCSGVGATLKSNPEIKLPPLCP
jgi:hypothetical protein